MQEFKNSPYHSVQDMRLFDRAYFIYDYGTSWNL